MAIYNLTQDTKEVIFSGNTCSQVKFNGTLVWPLNDLELSSTATVYVGWDINVSFSVSSSYTYSVSDTSVIQVTPSGNKFTVLGLKKGTSTITMRTGKGSVKTCTVTVMQATGLNIYKDNTANVLTTSTVQLYDGNSSTIVYGATATGTTDEINFIKYYGYTWESSDESIMTVETRTGSANLVTRATFSKPGYVILKAVSRADGTLIASCGITVVNA